MANRNVIPTPWAHKLRRFRYGAMPLVSFIGCVALMIWMWQRQGRQPNAVGEVEAVRVDVAAGADGLLVPLPHGPWTLFDSVQSGQLLALFFREGPTVGFKVCRFTLFLKVSTHRDRFR